MTLLSEVDEGFVVEVKEISAEQDLKRRILELKILPGSRFSVVKNNRGGYVVIETDGGKFGIPFDLADKIHVEVLGETRSVKRSLKW